jgi:hypothetical protein
VTDTGNQDRAIALLAGRLWSVLAVKVGNRLYDPQSFLGLDRETVATGTAPASVRAAPHRVASQVAG